VSLLRCRWAADLVLTPTYALRVIKSVAAALAELHRLRICHGDVYGHNVLADADGNAVLCDYGEQYIDVVMNILSSSSCFLIYSTAACCTDADTCKVACCVAHKGCVSRLL